VRSHEGLQKIYPQNLEKGKIRGKEERKTKKTKQIYKQGTNNYARGKTVRILTNQITSAMKILAYI